MSLLDRLELLLLIDNIFEYKFVVFVFDENVLDPVHVLFKPNNILVFIDDIWVWIFDVAPDK